MARNKKDFSAAATQAAGELYSTIADATAVPDVQEVQEVQKTRKERKTYSEQELQEFKDTLSTTGKKGAGLDRINMGFSHPNYEYIKTMARVRGETITAFVNAVFDHQREIHADTYRRALEFRDMFDGGI